jgi:adenine phosphoribosyltransferase
MINNIKKYIKENYINDIPDFPKPGITFRDISPLLKSTYFPIVINELITKVKSPDYWVGIDSRGFIFASALSINTGKGLVMCRKKGKLPPPVVSETYSLEYGEDTLEIQPGKGNIVIVDDVYATGGTMDAVEKLCAKAGYNVIDKLVLIDLKYLHSPSNVKSLIQYE